MEEGQELSSWMYSQITLAVDQLNSVHDAMDGKDGVKESVNESSVEIGDTVFLKSANKIATVIDRMGRSVIVKTGDGKKVKTVINNIKTLAQDNINEGNFGEIDIMAKEARNFNEFVKQFYKEFRDFPKDKDTLKWLKSLYDGRSVDESKDGLERVAQGLPQTEEEPINEWKAEEVLQQLGGRKFITMTGAKNFVKNDPKKQITFKIGGGAKGGINYVRITLTSMDLYNIEFLKARGTDLKVVAMEKGVYNDQLQQMFTKHTGMHTRL
jgi:ribosomal protein L21E